MKCACRRSKQRQCHRLNRVRVQVAHFLGKLAKKGANVEAMHIDEYEAAGELQVDMLRDAEASGIITKHSSRMLKRAHKLLRRHVADLSAC